jgi:hypothetical protein
MAAERHKYSIDCVIRYSGRLIDVLDRIRAIRFVLMVHIERDLGDDKELINIKILTPYAAKLTYDAIRKLAIGKIETLHDITFQYPTLTKIF